MLKGVCIGSGNVASALAPALSEEIEFVQVYSYNAANAEKLSRTLGCQRWTDDLNEIDRNADFYLISVRDDVIAEVAAQIKPLNPDSIVVHTSGGVDSDVLSVTGGHFGVIYPLQTFTKGKTVDLSNVPFFVEGNDDYALTVLKRIASNLSRTVHVADSATRAFIHVAGVMSSNFVNFMLLSAEKVLKSKNYDINVVRPLIEEVVEKCFELGPRMAQTGPARRADFELIKKHESLLDSEAAELYHYISDKIVREYH